MGKKQNATHVHLDIGSEADDEFVIESNLPPPVGHYRSPSQPNMTTAMAHATSGRLAQAARFFGVVEDPNVHYSYFSRREYEQANAPQGGNWAMNTVRQITGTMRRGNAVAHAPENPPPAFVDLTAGHRPPPSMSASLPATTVERQANNAVMDRLRKDEMYAMQLHTRSSSMDSARRPSSMDSARRPSTPVDPYEPSTAPSDGSSTRRKKSSTLKEEVLNDPMVRAQLEEMVPHRPYFMIIVTLAQLAMFAYSLAENANRTGSAIQLEPLNPMIGPNMEILVNLGAKFQACMFPADFVNPPECPLAYRDAVPPVQYLPSPDANVTVLCGDIERFCGLAPFNTPGVPDQWYRAIIANFLHGGVVHLLFNLGFQFRTGFSMERDIGFLRIMFIYLLSGIGGFLFACIFSPMTASVGASGALFGLLACLWLDLLQNWKLVTYPWKHFFRLFFITLVALGIGLLPYMDNYSHIGGFGIGLITGTIFMPSINFGPYDRRRKIILIILAIPSLVLVFFGMGYALSNGVDGRTFCPNCQYIDCLPVSGWCELDS